MWSHPKPPPEHHLEQTSLASETEWPSKITWSSHDNRATMCHLCHLVGRPSSRQTWDLSSPTLFSPNLFLSYGVLMLSDCSAVPTCVPVPNPDSEANCMCPGTLFTSPSPS